MGLSQKVSCMTDGSGNGNDNDDDHADLIKPYNIFEIHIPVYSYRVSKRRVTNFNLFYYCVINRLQLTGCTVYTKYILIL